MEVDRRKARRVECTLKQRGRPDREVVIELPHGAVGLESEEDRKVAA